MSKRKEEVKELRGRARKFSLMLLEDVNQFYNVGKESECEESHFNNEAIPLFYLFDELLKLSDKEESAFQLLLSIMNYFEDEEGLGNWDPTNERELRYKIYKTFEIIFETHEYNFKPFGISLKKCKENLMNQPRRMSITDSFEFLREESNE